MLEIVIVFIRSWCAVVLRKAIFRVSVMPMLNGIFSAVRCRDQFGRWDSGICFCFCEAYAFRCSHIFYIRKCTSYKFESWVLFTAWLWDFECINCNSVISIQYNFKSFNWLWKTIICWELDCSLSCSSFVANKCNTHFLIYLVVCFWLTDVWGLRG